MECALHGGRLDARNSEIISPLLGCWTFSDAEGFRRVCREIMESCADTSEPPDSSGAFHECLEKARKDTPTSWGGVLNFRRDGEHCEKYLVVRKGSHLPFEKHSRKLERIVVESGRGILLHGDGSDAERVFVSTLGRGDEFVFPPDCAHCIIGAGDLVVFESSEDPLGEKDIHVIFDNLPQDCGFPGSVGNNASGVPLIRVGANEISAIQYGWWKAGGPPYFRRPSLESLMSVRKFLLEKGICSDNAPAYGKGLTEMMMWIGYSYLEDWWVSSGRTTRKEHDTIFTKCGLYWPAETRQSTHGDMHWCLDRLLGTPSCEIRPEDVRKVVLGEFKDSCTRMHVDYIHGYMLHWPLRKGDAKDSLAMDWMLEGVVPAFAELYRDGKIGAAGFGNVSDIEMLKALNERCSEEGAKLGVAGFKVHYIQNESSIVSSDDKAASLVEGALADYCKENGIVRVAYSALGHGAPIAPPGEFVFVDHWGLSEGRQRRIHEFKAAKHGILKEISAKAGSSNSTLALAWLISKGIVPLFSSMDCRHIAENIQSFDFAGKALELAGEIGRFRKDYLEELKQI